MLDANTMTKIEECLVGYHEGNKSEREVKNFLAHYISPSATGLNERLVMRIDESFPQILIAHTGLVFQRFPGEFIKALIIAKQNHPSLRLGIQGGIPMIETTFNKKNVNKRDYNIVFQNGFFEDSEEMNILIDYFL